MTSDTGTLIPESYKVISPNIFLARRETQALEDGNAIAIPQVGELLHRYERRAA